MTKKIALFIIMSILFSSCTDSTDPLNQISNNQLRDDPQEYIPFDFEETDLGELHNSIVLEMYTGVEFDNPENVASQIWANFENYEYDLSNGYDSARYYYNDLVFALINQILDANFDLSGEEFSYLKDRTASPFFESVFDEIENMARLSQFEQNLDSIQNIANDQLEDFDYDAVKGLIIIAKSSAYLWCSESEGGYGLLDKITSKSSTKDVPKSVQNAVLADAEACVGYFVTIGVGGSITAALIPGTNLAFFLGWGISTAVGSALGALH